MKTLNYKGYIGSIEVSEEDNCLFGKILDLPNDTMISYEGETVEQLKSDFMEAVDAYIAYCKENGIAPHKSYSGSLNIRVSSETQSRMSLYLQTVNSDERIKKMQILRKIETYSAQYLHFYSAYP